MGIHLVDDWVRDTFVFGWKDLAKSSSRLFATVMAPALLMIDAKITIKIK